LRRTNSGPEHTNWQFGSLRRMPSR